MQTMFYNNPTLHPGVSEALGERACRIRELITRVVCRCRWGHIGGSYSLAELLAVLYGGGARLAPDLADDEGRDYVILSKAHCSPALYAALCDAGFLSEEQLYTYGTAAGIEGHLDKGNPRGVECSGGSLGLGLSYAVGLAAALRMQERYAQRVFCICGDGELNEGQMWEAMLCASQYRLDNLILLVDYNKVMAKSFLHEGVGMEPLADKLRAFGFHLSECDGHSPEEIHRAVYHSRCHSVTGKPNCVLLHTVKGRGVGECEFNYRWHTHAPDIETGNRFLKELAARYGRDYVPIETLCKDADLGLPGVIEEVLS